MSADSNSSAEDRYAAESLADLQGRRAAQQRRFYKNRPQRVGNVIAQLVQRRGYAKVRAAGQREDAWQQALENQNLAAWDKSTRVGPLKRGVLEIQVASSLLMQELTFVKEPLLEGIRSALPEENIKQIRFRVANFE